MPVTWDEENAAHLLSRAGFGGDAKDIAKFVSYGQQRAVDTLVDQRGIPVKGPGKSGDDANDAADRDALKAWWAKRMVKAKSRRLQEKMCLFWHDHFATSISVVKNNLWMAQQNRIFRLHGTGPFHTLCVEITRDPAMLDFLDGNVSTLTKPNENYPREVMELFVLGVKDLDGADNYTQDDVEQLTKALTGFQIQDEAGVLVPSRHDGGNKTLFNGKPYQMGPANLGIIDEFGVTFPPPTNVMDGLFAHTDTDGELTMPRFLGKKLWEYFAYPNPSKALIDDITADFIANPSGHPLGFLVSDLLRAIFMHDEFYSVAAKTQAIKNPCEYAFHAIRALRGSTNGKTLPDLLEAMGMDLFDPPGVNGWNQGLSWLSSGQFLARIEYAQTLAAGRDGNLKVTPKKIVPPGATSAAQVVDHLLGLLGVASYMPAGARQALIDYIDDPAPITDFTTTDALEKKVRGVLVLMLALPEFQIH